MALSENKRLYLIDGSGFIFRAYHALPPLTRPDGTPVGAVYGFVNMIMRLVEGANSDYIAVIFDAARKNFRNDMYAEYKAHRPPAPDDLIPQFPLVRDAARAMNLPAVELEGYEADDLIAAYTRLGREQGMEVVIVSSDKDLMQLVGEGVTMYDAMKQKTIGVEQVIEKFGVGPEKVREVLALIGDTSDNIPGVPGIGPKTAAELIIQYGSLEGLLGRTSDIKQVKRRETIENNTEKARLSYELVKLCDDCPVPVPLNEFAFKKYDPETLVAFLQQQGFKTLTQRIQQKSGGAIAASVSPSTEIVLRTETLPAKNAVAGEQHYTLVRSEPELKQWIEKATRAGAVAFDTETTSLDAMQARLVGFSLCIEPGHACYVPLNHMNKGSAPAPVQASLFDDGGGQSVSLQRMPGQMEEQQALALLKPLLEDRSVLKIGQNIKYDMLVLKKYCIAIFPLDDTMLMSYVLAAGKHNHGMDVLSERYLGHKPISYDEITGTGRQRITFAEVELEKAMQYAAEDADVTLRLQHALKSRVIAEHLVSVYERIERPLVPVLVEMEEKGIKVDRALLKELSRDFAARLGVIEKEVYALVGMEFNIGSPKQLGEVLFDKMGVGGGKKSSKSGAYSTGAGILEELAENGNALAAKVLDWRQLAKLKSTYSDALEAQINPDTQRVHTSFAMAVASTGRLSSSDPNLQNIPIRTEEGKKIRRCFIAETGHKLISADYSQIELRLLAHMADIPSLKEAFKNGDDIHAITASQIFGVPVNQVDGNLRRAAKTINFGIIYGMSAHGLAVRLGIGRSEAAEYIKKYFEQYPGIREYMETTKQFAREHGYVKTLYGRRCHVPGINDKNGGIRSFSERAAINAPLQGTAADIIKKAMIRIDACLKAEKYPIAMLLQVHDELVFEVTEEAVEKTIVMVKREMESSASLSVPITVETGIGNNWGETH